MTNGECERLREENALMRKALTEIRDATAFAHDEVTTVGYINRTAQNALTKGEAK